MASKSIAAPQSRTRKATPTLGSMPFVRSPRTLIAACVMAGTLAGAGCKKRTFNTTQVKHEAGQPVRGSEPWRWAQVDAIAVATKAIKREDPNAVVLGADHALAKRAQFWVSELHARMARILPGVPEPKVAIVVGSSPNAAVPHHLVCFKIPVMRKGAQRPGPIDKVWAITRDGFNFTPEGLDSCDPENPHAGRLGEILAWLGRRTPGCEMWVEKDSSQKNIILISDRCPVALDGLQNGVAQGFGLSVAPNVVIAHTGLFTDASLPSPMNTSTGEERFVATLMHELGHYYRSHALIFPGEYNYWYQRTFRGELTKPSPTRDPSHLKLIEDIRSGKGRNQPRIEGQKRSTELYVFLRTLYVEGFMSTLRSGNAALLHPSCVEAFDTIYSGTAPHEITHLYPRMLPGDESQTKILLGAEEKLLACAENVKLSKGLARGSLSIVSINGLLGKSITTRFTLPVEGNEGKTLGSLLAALEAELMRTSSQFDENIAEAARRRLGLYTVEQEADALALEFLAMLGLRVSAAWESQYEVGVWGQKHLGFNAAFEVSMEDCLKLRAAQWNPPPFVSSLQDVHHSACYRVFDVETEHATHGFPQATPPAFPQPSWSQLVSLARETEAKAAASRGTEGIAGDGRFQRLYRPFLMRGTIGNH